MLEREPGDLAGIVRATRARKVPVALGVEETRAWLAKLCAKGRGRMALW